MSEEKSKRDSDVKGEGNYTATRNFDRAQEKFVQTHKKSIPEMGEKAKEALDGPEGKELRDAEKAAKDRSHAGNSEN